MGLGLNICKQIVEKLGGSINVIAQPNGAKFSFKIKVWSYEESTEDKIKPEEEPDCLDDDFILDEESISKIKEKKESDESW